MTDILSIAPMRHMQWLVTIIIALALSACNTTPPKKTGDSRARSVVIVNSADISEKRNVTSIIKPTNAGNVTTASNIEVQDKGKTYEDVWVRIRDNLTFDRNVNKKQLKEKLAWYKRNQDYLDRVAERAAPYIYYIVGELEKRDMPLDLALLPVIESAYHPFAYSPARASGIWQFMPRTGKHYGLKQNWWYDGRRDITEATRAALDYLEKLENDFNGDWLLVIAAYNFGEGNVTRAIERNKRSRKKTDFWSLKLPRETRGYVPSLLAVAEIVAHPEKYKLSLQAIANEPYFAEVNIGKQIDLALAADLAGLNMDEIYTLNPGYNRWATDPDGPHTLLIPLAKEESFQQKLATILPSERMTWKRHIIRQGESLNLIANRYHTSVATLKQVNDLRGNIIRTGHSLLIPTSKQPLKFYTLSQDSRRYRGLKKTDGNKYVYTIRRGDNLWDISRHYGVSVRNLTSWNGISANDYLRPKQKLTLWIADAEEPAKTRKAGSKTTTVQTADRIPGSIHYTVKEGDSLWLIARRYDVRVKSLEAWNNISSRKFLQPGQQLTVHLGNSATVPVNTDKPTLGPFNYTVRNGDSLWLIARRFGTTIDKLRLWNKLSKGKYLQPGQTLILHIQEV